MSEPFDWLCVFDLLTNESFASLRTLLGDGVPSEEFCDVLFKTCLEQDPDIALEPRRTEILDVITKLFAMIDINGNGDVSWDEFSHYVVHAVQSGTEVSGRHISQHIVFPKVDSQKLHCPRLKKTALRYIGHWEKFCFLEVQTRQTVLSLYKSAGDRIRLYARTTTDQTIEDVAYCDSVNAMCVTTVSEKLQFYALQEDPVLAESGQLQHLTLTRDHYLEGRHPVLRYDPESSLLFAGGNNGTVSILDPSKDFAVMPPLLQKVRLHGTQPVVDIAVLPERGTKMMLSSGLDGKIQMYDIIRQEFFGELGSQIAAHSLSFSTDYSCLVTCSHKSLDPLVWSPHAVSNPFIGKLVDEKFGSSRNRLVECYCPPNSQYCFSGDCNGLIKLWDMRKMRIVRAFKADAHPLHTEGESSESHLWLRSFTAATAKLDVLSCCRSETGVGLYFVKADTVPERNPVVTHDDPIVSLDFALDADSLVTASKDCAKFWALESGAVSHHLADFWQGEIQAVVTACSTDSSGKRFYLGTDVGVVSVHSTLTCGMIGECEQHTCRVFALLLRKSTLFSSGADGSVHISNVAGDAPVFLFAAKMDRPVTVLAFDANVELCLAVVGDLGGTLSFYDCTEGANGALTAVSRATRDESTGRNDVTDVTELPQDAVDISCVKLAGKQPFAAFGDVRGYLGIVAVRPHPWSGTRLCRWKCYFPRASVTIFAVALAIDYDQDTETLFVADDQGHITLWACESIVRNYHLNEVAWPLSIAERLALPRPLEQPLARVPKLLAHFSAMGNSSPVKGLRVIEGTIFALVDNVVTLLTQQGAFLGTLMQGRGTALANVCTPYTFRQEVDDENSLVRTDSSLAPTMSRKLTQMQSLGSLRRGSLAAAARQQYGFRAMTDTDYNMFCLSAPEVVENERSYEAAAGVVLSTPPPTPRGVATSTPPPTPRGVATKVCRFSRPLTPAAEASRAVPFPKDLPYFLQMRASSAASGVLPARGAASPTYDRPPADPSASLLARIAERLNLDDDVPYVCLRPPLDTRKAAGIVEIFSGAPSSEQDWKSELQLHPSSNAAVTATAAAFQPCSFTVGLAMPACVPLQHIVKAAAARETDGALVAVAASKPVRFVRFQRKEPVKQLAVAPIVPTIDDFIMPVRQVPRSAAEQLREKVMRSLNFTPATDLAAEVVSPSRPITPLKDMYQSECAQMARAASSASRPKPLTFTVGYGQSSAPPTSPPSWQTAQKALERRTASRQASASRQLRLGSGATDRSLSRNSQQHGTRQAYLQLLLHLPRVRRPNTVEEAVDVVRRL